MAKRIANNGKSIAAEATQGKANGAGSKEYTAAELKAIYAEGRKRFTAADLQKYTVIEKGIPVEKVIAEMEEIQRKTAQKKIGQEMKVGKRKTNEQAKSKLAKKKADNGGRETAEDAKLKAIYAESRKRFTAAELQKYTVIEEGIPADQVLKEIREIHRKYLKRKRALHGRD